MAEDSKKGRGSRPRVQGKTSPTKIQRRIDRTVYRFPSVQAEGPEPPRTANSELPCGSPVGNAVPTVVGRDGTPT